MFLKVSVILFTGGTWSRGGLVLGGVPGPGGVPGLGGCLVPEVCLVLGYLVLGVPGPRVGWGGLVQVEPGGDSPGMATAAGGMHPTRMHSCCEIVHMMPWVWM